MKNKTCQKCNKHFPQFIYIDGKKHGLHNRLYCLDCSPFKSHNTSNLVIKNLKCQQKTKICPNCHNEFELNEINFYFRLHRNTYHNYCKICFNKRALSRQQQIKRQCVEYKGGKCFKCGYNKSISALEFHHLDPTKKEFTLSRHKCWNFEKLKPELDKCILICSNCHREEHESLMK